MRNPRPVNDMLHTHALDPLYARIQKLSGTIPKCDINLALHLINQAQELDLRRTKRLLTTLFNQTVTRDVVRPPAYTDPYIIGQDWADHTDHPLEPHEQWNMGRRASNINHAYQIDPDGLPINPFFNYGINGRGTIGRYGPNHAVDMAPCQVMENAHGTPALHVLGIIRGDTNLPALCGGFTHFKRNAQGTYPHTRDIVIQSQIDEFLEEMVLGSVPLDGSIQVDRAVDDYCTARVQAGETITQGKINTVRAQMITQQKLAHIKRDDPGFITRLKYIFTNAADCYAGPVISSTRNTNNAWMETRLSTFMLDADQWNWARDGKPYDFVGGDDAACALWHEITPDLVAQARDHSALFAYVLAAQLLDPDIAPILRPQAKMLAYTLQFIQ